MPPIQVQGDQLHHGYVDLDEHELRNAVLQNLGADPDPIDGRVLYRTDTGKARVCIAGVWKDLATSDDVGAGAIPASLVNAKGDLLVATADNTVTRKAVGADGTLLVAASAQADGMLWRTLTEADIHVGTTARLLGRTTAGAGPAQLLSLASDLSFSGTTLRTAAFTGDITKSAGSVATAIGANKVTYAQMQDITAEARVLGRAAGAGAGDPTELTPAQVKTLLALGASEVTFTPAANIVSTNVQAAIEEAVADLTAQITAAAEAKQLKDPVRVWTTANIVLSGTQTIDGVNVVAGDRVGVKNQTLPADNGIYVVAAGGWTRAGDANTTAEVARMATFATEGATGIGDQYTANAPATLGVNDLTWVKTSEGNTVYTAGNGLALTGVDFSVNVGTGLELSGDAVRIAAAAAGNGLIGGAGTALAVGEGTGIDVTGDAVSIDTAIVERKVVGALAGGANTEDLVHNLGTRDVSFTLRNNADPWDEVQVYNEALDANTIRVHAAAGQNLPAGYRWKVSG